MSSPHAGQGYIVWRWWGRVRTELAELSADLVAALDAVRDRLRTDPPYRRAVVRGLVSGLLNVLRLGPRATVLWLVALACHAVLEVLDSLQRGFPDPQHP